MAQVEGVKVKAGRKKGFSAVYVNRFGKHVSGSVIEFAGKSRRREEQRRPAGPGEGTCPIAASGAELSPEPGLKTCNQSKRTSFNPPAPIKGPGLSLEQADAETRIQNGGLSAKNSAHSNTSNPDVFKFPVSANSGTANEKMNTTRSSKKREVFRVIYKMLHENEHLRTRLLNTSQKSTVVADMPTISNREKGSPKALDVTPFGWV